MLIRIYDSANENGIWRIMHDNEIYKLYDERITVKVIKTQKIGKEAYS